MEQQNSPVKTVQFRLRQMMVLTVLAACLTAYLVWVIRKIASGVEPEEFIGAGIFHFVVAFPLAYLLSWALEIPVQLRTRFAVFLWVILSFLALATIRWGLTHMSFALIAKLIAE